MKEFCRPRTQRMAQHIHDLDVEIQRVRRRTSCPSWPAHSPTNMTQAREGIEEWKQPENRQSSLVDRGEVFVS